jgi:Predicted pyridoxal phosphate-dependent enzyme apparently involved in regulation of cell wall biogenesis
MFVSANGRYPGSGIIQFERLAEENNIALIEDAAQSLGSFYPDGRHIGCAGIVGSFSFSAPKIISTGQGGALITSDDELARKLRRLKDFGRSGGGNDIHDSIGYNFKFTELQACLGIEQMNKLQWRIKRKKEIYSLYKQKLAGIDEVKFFNQDLVHTTPWFIDVLVDDRENLIQYLKEKKIGSRLMYPPINRQIAYNTEGDYPVSFLVGEKGLWLPSASQLTNEEVEYICSSIQSFYK